MKFLKPSSSFHNTFRGAVTFIFVFLVGVILVNESFIERSPTYWEAGSFIRARDTGLLNQNIFTDSFQSSKSSYNEILTKYRGKKVERQRLVVQCYTVSGLCNEIPKRFESYYSAIRINVYCETIIDYCLCKYFKKCGNNMRFISYVSILLVSFLISFLFFRSTRNLDFTSFLFALILSLVLLTSFDTIEWSFGYFICLFPIAIFFWTERNDSPSQVKWLLFGLSVLFLSLLSYEIVPTAYLSLFSLVMLHKYWVGQNIMKGKFFLKIALLFIFVFILAISIHIVSLWIEFGDFSKSIEYLKHRFAIRSHGNVETSNKRVSLAASKSIWHILRSFRLSSDGILHNSEGNWLLITLLIVLSRNVKNKFKSIFTDKLSLIWALLFMSYLAIFARVLVFKAHAGIKAHQEFLSKTFEFYFPIYLIAFFVYIVVENNCNGTSSSDSLS